MADKRSAIYHNMYTMLDAGMDILKAFKILNQGLKGSYKRSWEKLEQSVVAGSSIADAMKANPKSFDQIDILMIDAAERSGNLPKALELLAKWYEFRHRIINKIRSGLIFPLIILHFGAFLAPLPSVLLDGLGLNPFLREVLFILEIFYLPAIAIWIFAFLGKKLSTVRYVLDYLVLWIPALGKGIFNLSLSRYSRSFYMLSSAGLGAIETAETASELTGNFFVKSLVQGGVQATKDGGNASEGFVTEHLPAEFMNLWQVGEESGTMDKVTAKLADITADRAEFWFETFANWLPKVIYACVCLMMILSILKGYSKIYGGLGADF